MLALPAPEFASLVFRLPVYGGAMAARYQRAVEEERREEQRNVPAGAQVVPATKAAMKAAGLEDLFD